MQLSNYLFFMRGCEPALAFYARCGLGRVTALMRYGVDGVPLPDPALLGQVMHARFEGPGVLFHAADTPDAEPMRGSAHLLEVDDEGRARSVFSALAEGGTVTTPMGMQPWGDLFGKLTDGFGVQWMVNCRTAPA